jgi:hypothetical protein
METSYLKLLQGSRLTNYMGLGMADGVNYLIGKNYLHLDIPVVGAVQEDGTTSMDVKRNQHVWIKAAASVNVKGRNFIDIEPNSALAAVGQVQSMYRIHPDSGKQELGFWFSARKDVNLSDLVYAVRIYMPA